MRVVHFSDTHLGFRRFTKTTAEGVNQREQDVADAFGRLIDATITERPDIVLIPGDVFHMPRPSNRAILTALAGFTRLRAALPDTLVVIAAGNHDLARTTDTPCILTMLSGLDIVVADRVSVRLRVGDVSILAVPECVATTTPLDIDPDAELNLLCLHGEVAGVIPGSHAPDTLHRSAFAGWDYVALGHYHTFARVAENAYYSGAPEFTSSNPWAEIGEPRGYLVYEPDCEPTFMEVPGARRHVDLGMIEAEGWTAAEIDAEMAIRATDICGAVARCIIRGAPREVRQDMDHKATRRYQADALSLVIDTRTTAAAQGFKTPSGRPRESLEALLVTKIRNMELPHGIALDDLLALSARYMGEAQALESGGARA